MSNAWEYSDQAGFDNASVLGYTVEATDGEIGDVADESTEVHSYHIVVDTGAWIFEKKRLVPAGAVERIDHGREKVFVALTKAEIKDAPDFVAESVVDHTHRTDVENYYAPWIGIR